jgi:starvation-inducible outer membrane lipoprotein
VNKSRLILATLCAIALAGCSSTPPEIQTGVQCVKTQGGQAAVTDKGIEVLQAGRCTAWTIGPTRREQAAYNARHGGAQ